MSATGRGRERESRDFYPTPQIVADRLVRTLDIRPGARVLEPSAGSGNWVRAILDYAAERHGPDHGVIVDAVDIDEQHREALEEAANGRVRIRSTLSLRREPPGYDWIIGNPPYGQAAEHVQHALYLLREGGHLAYLLSAGWLHPRKRRPLRQAFTPCFEIGLQERPPFLSHLETEDDDDGANNSTDATEFSLYVWRRGHRGDWRKRMISWRRLDEWHEDLVAIRYLDWEGYDLEQEAAEAGPR